MALMLVRLLVMARLLNTYSFGQFSAGLLVSTTFSMLACLGLQMMLYRDLPVMIIQRRMRAGVTLIAQCVLVASACAGLGILAALAGWSVAGLPTPLLVISLFHGLSQQLFMVASAEIRSRGEPLGFAWQSFARAIAVLGVGAVAAVATGSTAWILFAEAVGSLVLAQLALSSTFRGARMSGGLAYHLAVRAMYGVNWRSAMTLFALGWVGFAVMNLDRWVAAEWLSPTQFAQYAFAWTVLMVAQSGQLLVNASVFPLLARNFGKFGAKTAYRTCLWISSLVLALGILLAVPAWWLVHIGIVQWFPDYRPALDLIPLFIAVAVLRLSDYWTSYMIIVGQEARLLALNFGAALAAGLVWVLWVRPSADAIRLWDIAWLAVLLSALNYLVTCVACWSTGRRLVHIAV